MREAIFILLVLTALAGLTLYRYRRQVAMAWNIWQTVKGVREQVTSSTKKISPEGRSEALVRCDHCGVWTPDSRAIRGKAGKLYCSNECAMSVSITA